MKKQRSRARAQGRRRRAAPSTPNVAGRNAKTPARDSDGPLLTPLHSAFQKIEFVTGSVLWLAALGYFWAWWLQPVHNIGTFRFVLVSVVLAWVTLLPLYFVLIFMNAKVPSSRRRAPRHPRVAMVVTKAPSEPFPIVAETLEAMLDQTYPHDTWLADEDPSPATIAWCEARGVRISTRKGRDDYHRQTWPRRTKCKEGNLAFFYDHYGYEQYDIVSQLDADHVPDRNYLEEVVKPFADPRVGYVSAPSICDRNARQSWSARGRLYVEGTLHGALQAGYTNGWAPLCIGSHYAVRTSALKEIGGLGPELAEDHSTTMMFNAHGWRGVHAMHAIAHGDGPNTYADLVTQEFQWSRSLMMVLLQYSPKYLPMMPWKLRFQFLFSQLWYPLFSVFMALMYAMPIAALALDINFVGVTYPEFLLHFAPISIVLILMAFRWKAGGWSRPVDAKVLSWEGMLFLFARWPWSLVGTLAAIRDHLTGTVVEFRVTPKGTDAAGPLPARVLFPYVLLTAGSALPVILFADIQTARGFYLFACVNALIYAVLLAVILLQHLRENGIPRESAPLRLSLAQGGLAMAVMALPVTGAMLHGEAGVQAVFWGTDRISLPGLTPKLEQLGSAQWREIPDAMGWRIQPETSNAVPTGAVTPN